MPILIICQNIAFYLIFNGVDMADITVISFLLQAITIIFVSISKGDPASTFWLSICLKVQFSPSINYEQVRSSHEFTYYSTVCKIFENF